MPTIIVDHRLKSYDAWLKIYSDYPPPAIGTWKVLRGRDDPNRVFVIGEFDASEVDAVNEWAALEQTQETFAKVNDISEAPIDVVWTE